MDRRGMLIVAAVVLVVGLLVLTIFNSNRQAPTSPDGEAVVSEGVADGALEAPAPAQ